jgi:sulfate/thiosulfate transport system ATP-binding protein
VMSFLGPVTRLDGVLVRPHDVDVFTTDPGRATVAGTVERVLRVGFEVRLTVRPVSRLGETGADGVPAAGHNEDVTVVLTRAHARELGIEPGGKLWLAANPGAATVPVQSSRERTELSG